MSDASQIVQWKTQLLDGAMGGLSDPSREAGVPRSKRQGHAGEDRPIGVGE